jgi:AcrR family transcriptional regulator
MRRTPISVDPETASRPPRLKFLPKKGRPPNAMAGDVEERILDAATAMFVQHGFGGASLERIAEAAGAGKATLYSRYASKDALFSEVVRRNCDRSLRVAYEAPQSASLVQRLISLMLTLVTRLLTDEVIGLIRMVIADAPRFPSLATLTREASRSRAMEAVATLIDEHSGHTDGANSRAVRKRDSRAVATQLLDAIIAPMLMRALMEENLIAVRSDIGSHVERTMAIFVAAKTLDTLQ